MAKNLGGVGGTRWSDPLVRATGTGSFAGVVARQPALLLKSSGHHPLRQVTFPPRKPRLSRRPLGSSGPVWLFDLDNTLHDASAGMFREIDRCMTQAVMTLLGVDEGKAQQLRRTYWQRYGATLIGMVEHHRVDAAEFLRLSHDFDILSHLHGERGLASLLRRLPGRKVLFTNAPEHYALTVLRGLGIHRCFEAVWAVEQMRIFGRFQPKPSTRLMRYVLAREGVSASRAILVEDTPANLKAARRVGMRGVHLAHPGTPFHSRKAGRPLYIDGTVSNLRTLLVRRRFAR